MNLRISVIKSVQWTTIGTVVVSIFQFLQNVILARLLTPEDFGLMAIIMIFVGLGRPISELGLRAAVIQKQDISPVQYATLYWLSLLVGLVLFIGFYLSIPLLSQFFKQGETLNLYLKVSFTCFLIFPIGALHAAVLAKVMKFDLLNRINIWNGIGTFICAVTLAYLDFGLWALVGGFLFNASIQSFCSLVWGWKYLNISLRFNLPEVKQLIQFGLFETASGFVNFFSANVDKFLIGKFLGAHALGLYTIAWNLVLFPLKKINPILVQVAYPVFSKIQNQVERLEKYYHSTVYVLMAVNIPLLFGLAVLAKAFLFLVYGPQWIEASGALSILCLVGLLKSFANPGGSLILAKGRADVGFYWNVFWSIGVGIFIAVFLWIKPSIISVAWAQLAAGLLIGWYWHFLIVKIGEIGYAKLLKKVGALLLYIIPLLGINILFEYWGNQMSFLGFGLQVVLSAIVYLLLIYLFFKNLIALAKNILK